MNLLTTDEALDYLLPQLKPPPEPAPEQQPVIPVPSFLDFKKSMFRRYLHPKHMDYLDGYLLQVMRFVETEGREGIGHLIISLPPRHGKTKNLAQLFPAYLLGKHPDWKVILASYQADLAIKSGRNVRNLINSDRFRLHFPGVRLAPDSTSSRSFNLAADEGGMESLGVGGGVTGKGGHILIADDLLSGRADAESATIRNKTWGWWTDDYYSRGEVDYAAFIVCGTRWHLDDPIGRLLKNEPEKWVVVNLPALALENDPLDRDPGEPLWSERWGKRRLLEIKKTQGEYGFNALYQGSPIPAEGNLFKRKYFNIVDQHPPVQSALRFWDLAMSEKTSADYTVGLKYLLCEDGHRYIPDLARGQIDWGGLTDYMADVMLKDGPNVIQYIEMKGYMSRAVQTLVLDPRLHGYSIFGVDVDTDKLTRALPAVSKAAAGVIHLLNRSWNETFISELCAFPFAENDDQVDALSGAENALGGMMTEASGGVWQDDQGGIAGVY